MATHDFLGYQRNHFPNAAEKGRYRRVLKKIINFSITPSAPPPSS